MPSPTTAPKNQTAASATRLETFPPPRVDLAPDGVLDPEAVPSRGCPLVVPYLDTLDKDRVTYRWSSSVVGGSDMDFRNLTTATAGQEVEFMVFKQFVTASRYRSVTVDYYITRGGVIIGYSEPLVLLIGDATLDFNPPRLDGAVGELMDLAVTPRELEACLAVDEYRLQVGDSGEIHVTGAPDDGSTKVSFTVEEGQAGRDKWVALPRAVFLANVGREIRLDCTVLRVDGTQEVSRTAVYDVRHSIGNGRLQVMGARSRGGCHLLSGGAYWLTALDADTLQPIEARWRYNHETTLVSGLRFRDTQQDLPLHVQLDDDWVTIRQRNLAGNGNLISNMSANNAAFAARADLGNLVAWGKPNRGGDLVAPLPSLTDIIALSPCGYGFAARRADGSVVSWGYQATVTDEIAALKDIMTVSGNGYTFAALRSNESVVAWAVYSGIDIPDDVRALTNIKTVVGSLNAFAVLLADGSIKSWGNPASGADLPDDIAQLNDIVEITANDAAFAARRANGSVVAWGYENGNTVPPAIALLTDIVEVGSSRPAFAARRADGSIVAWGHADNGGNLPDAIKALTDIVSVTGNRDTFIAQRANGSLVSWGKVALPAPISARTDIVQVVPAAAAFAALCADGSVVAWGHIDYGGAIPDEIALQLTDVRAIYSNSHAFAALTADGRVVTWGAGPAGGNSDAVADQLNGKISYVIEPQATSDSDSPAKTVVVASDQSVAVAR